MRIYPNFTATACLLTSVEGFSHSSLHRTIFHRGSRSGTSRLFASSNESGGEFWEANTKCWRPTVNDVERISWGKPAKKKGTGSRGVPHRLNSEERFLFDQARRKGFLEVAGSGWRSQRRDAPLLNTYRSLCDARGQVSIVLHKGNTGIDELVLDISPLRTPLVFQEIASRCLQRCDGGEICTQENQQSDEIVNEEEMLSSWNDRPIYQLPPFSIVWTVPRHEAKATGKQLAILFDTKEKDKSSSRKPIGVKPGKNRRHGGYGIG